MAFLAVEIIIMLFTSSATNRFTREAEPGSRSPYIYTHTYTKVDIIGRVRPVVDDRCHMAIHQRPADPTYRCPDCGGRLTFEHQSWGCTACAYVPKHGAD